MRAPQLLLFILCTQCATLLAAAEQDTAGAVADTVLEQTTKTRGRYYSHRVLMDLGFSHWVSDRFRAAIMGKDVSVGIRVHPGTEFVQVQGRFDGSTVRTVADDTTFADFHDKFIGFTTLALGLGKAFELPTQAVEVHVSLGVVLVSIEDHFTRCGMSSGFGADYLFRHVNWEHFGLGVAMAMRCQMYNLTDRDAPLSEWLSPEKEVLDRDTMFNMSLLVSLF